MTAMTLFSVKEPSRPLLDTSSEQDILRAIKDFDVTFERWTADVALAAGAGQDDVLKAYGRDVARLKAAQGYQSADVVRMHPDHPDKAAMRSKFLAEHRHSDDEVRFFVEGAGAFYLRNDDRIVKLVCEAGDLLSVPANTRHWFDMGERPFFTAIRLFTSPDGWVAQFTGDDIATHVPAYRAPAEQS